MTLGLFGFGWAIKDLPESAKKPKPQTPRKFLTVKISNIPKSVTREKLEHILAETTSDGTNETNFIGSSYTPAAISGLSDRFCVATATFRTAPSCGELETAIKREIGPEASRLKVDEDFFGLTPLADPLQDTEVDIVAVTGLAGHAFGSWKSKGKESMWLRDFLPASIPNTRILTYGYDTKLPGSQSEASIRDLSRRLLESIKTTRDGQLRNRPLILIGHSLGGLVVKEALAEASNGSEDDQAVFRACYAVFLFAVPNRGLDNSSLQAMVKGQPNEQLIRNLSPSSSFLTLLRERFDEKFTLKDSKIICVFETKTTPTVEWSPRTASWERTGEKVMMVPVTSATNSGPNEKAYDRLSIDADHSNIVKFSDQSDEDYVIIESRIRRLVADAPGVIRDRLSSHVKKLSHLESVYIQALKAPNYAAFRNYKIDDPTDGTLGWFLENNQFRSWKTEDRSSVLWIQGSPGQGKTILAKFLLDHLENSLPAASIRATVIYFFFFNQDDDLRTVSAALRSLIKQLLSARNAFQVISHATSIENFAIPDDDLWDILKELLCAPIFGTIYCVVDGVDECQDDELRRRFLRYMTTLVQPKLGTIQAFQILKLLFISRPTVQLSRELSQYPKIYLKANLQDLKTFIKDSINTLGLSMQLPENASDLLAAHAEQTFLWVSIVLKKLQSASSLLSQADLEEMISDSPSDLTELYQGIVDQIMEINDVAQQKLLTWAVYGRRALTLVELEEALAVQEGSISKESTDKHRISLTKGTITSAAGVILEVINGRLYLIHQSAKDFLLKSKCLATAQFCRSLHPNIYLARVCMTFLCFEDFELGPCGDREVLAERNRQHPFLSYAARHWHRHIETTDDIQSFTHVIDRMISPGSPILLSWAEASGILGLEEAENTWEVATKVNIPWLAEFKSRDTIIDNDIVQEASRSGARGYNSLRSFVRGSGVRVTEEAIRTVAKEFDQEMMRHFLDNNSHNFDIPALLKEAVGNTENGVSVLRLLMEVQGKFTLTDELVHLIASNERNGDDILELVLQNENVDIPETTLAKIVRIFHPLVVSALLNTREDRMVTEMVFDAAMEHKSYYHANLLKDLFHQRVEGFQVTEQLMERVALELDEDIMGTILQTQSQDLRITEAVIIAAAKNLKGPEMVALLLKERGQGVRITEEVLKAAAGNRGHKAGEEIMAFLLSERGSEVRITEEVLKAAAGNRGRHRVGEEIMALLLKERHQEVQITEEVLKAAAGNSGSHGVGEAMMTLLLQERGQGVQITEEILKVAAGNPGDGARNIIDLLLSERGQDVQITEDILIAAAGNPGEEAGTDIISLLLKERSQEVQITEEVLKAAEGNPGDGAGNIISLLLENQGRQALRY
ncbi:hypothetical protein BGZ61DRAFT_365055 [Ilyonectria robusta]|uniref:uncharacterized protein n=1 Tax=Ilyonectria robusta TaxID=1079257 RepID=UPI001E8EC265|nr:uncharacterized protein BGZ61DRAFT_365055 [Ilyonectria robusta]KAH8667741.1 hypothetical protein BGZ61DRAFT_365055 [Ilyonectria robusta]